MKYDMQIGKDEYLMAAKLMSLSPKQLAIVRVINGSFAVIFAIIAIILMTSEIYINYKDGITAILFGLSSACVCLIVKSFKKIKENNAEANVKILNVTYQFGENVLTGTSSNNVFELFWKDLKRWGDQDGYIFLIFKRKQVVLLDKHQLHEYEIDEINDYLKVLSMTK